MHNKRKKLWARRKPGSVSDDHLSRPAVTNRLKRPTFRAGTGRPQAMKPCCPFRSCSGWGLHEGYVTILLRELLPHDFTLTTGIPVRRCVSVAPFPMVTHAGRYPASLPCGARTFLTQHGAARDRLCYPHVLYTIFSRSL